MFIPLRFLKFRIGFFSLSALILPIKFSYWQFKWFAERRRNFARMLEISLVRRKNETNSSVNYSNDEGLKRNSFLLTSFGEKVNKCCQDRFSVFFPISESRFSDINPKPKGLLLGNLAALGNEKRLFWITSPSTSTWLFVDWKTTSSSFAILFLAF